MSRRRTPRTANFPTPIPMTPSNAEKLEKIADKRDLQPATLCRLALIEFIEKNESEYTHRQLRVGAE